MLHPTPDPLWLRIVYLLRWHKPAGRLILLLPALWALVLAAEGRPPLGLVLVVTVGTLATSALGCVVNDFWDRDIDPQVERTKTRPLAAKTLSVQVALAVALIALLCAFGLSFYLTPLSFWLWFGAAPVIILYPLAKRFFPAPQLVLSLAWGFAVLIPWSAVTGSLNGAAWELWGAVVLWTLGFDTIYALADREDDRRLGVNSSALFFGKWAVWAVGAFFLATALLLAYLGWQLALSPFYWGGLTLAVFGWARQIYRLQRPEPAPELYGRLFGENVWLGFLILGGMALGSVIS